MQNPTSSDKPNLVLNEPLLKSIRNPLYFWLLLLTKLPMGILSGLRLVEVSPERAVVTVKYQYITKNPFRSLYFGCMTMAAELSTGVLGLVYTMNLKPDVSMLLVKLEAQFVKKARGKVFFTCEDGLLLGHAANETRKTGEPQIILVTSIGRDEEGNEVARFLITWSMKGKLNKA